MLLSITLVLGIVYLTFRSIARITKSSGYTYAPLMIVGSLSYVLEFLFIEYYHNTVNGFSQAFNLGIRVEPMVFRIFPFVAGIWSMHILYARSKLLTEKNIGRVYALTLVLPVVYLILSMATLIVMILFPPQSHGHH